MRKHRPAKKQKPTQPESVVFDRSPGRHKLESDLNVVTTNAGEMGLRSADIVRALLQKACDIAMLAKERGEDLSSLQEEL